MSSRTAKGTSNILPSGCQPNSISELSLNIVSYIRNKPIQNKIPQPATSSNLVESATNKKNKIPADKKHIARLAS